VIRLGGATPSVANARVYWSIAQALQYLQQIVAAVSHMHGRNVVHRDIKPENCVSDSHGNLKLIDFGAASAAHGPSSPAGMELLAGMLRGRCFLLLCRNPGPWGNAWLMNWG
jgi:serine/threonine protein kinase